ncbi:MAG: Acyl-phosphate:glycerol-3-phosphate O-acyltransferase PlsY [Candidatus Saccharicenans subterraneus]|uniref:Glycerol-3-phosphate acyltransferase n=1 Tax=Candidatus Saccharicenans subterraneus TaxID=2508984 RepID=A0A3E2BMS3_9BACT|nr:MAG: Acyl-phosphate:glycerol-3-phosphate O-acyltransferase PlsY [Candidatus Saccharicenans subterraneum]
MKILLVVASYFLGAFPTGFLLVRLSSRKDIRKIGSGSTGATNVLRYGGWKMAIPVMVIDLLKGFLPAFLAVSLLADRRLAVWALLAAVIGHCYPIYLGFRGGKGVATTVGGFLYLAPLPLVISLGLTLLMLLFFRYVSLATLTGLLALPLLVLLLTKDYFLFWTGWIFFLVILFRHRENIKRLLAGTERKFGEKLNG